MCWSPGSGANAAGESFDGLGIDVFVENSRVENMILETVKWGHLKVVNEQVVWQGGSPCVVNVCFA